MPEGSQGPPPMYQLHKRLFPVLLRLACDVDQVNRLIYKHFSLLKIPVNVGINLQFYLEVILTHRLPPSSPLSPPPNVFCKLKFYFRNSISGAGCGSLFKDFNNGV